MSNNKELMERLNCGLAELGAMLELSAAGAAELDAYANLQYVVSLACKNIYELKQTVLVAMKEENE